MRGPISRPRLSGWKATAALLTLVISSLCVLTVAALLVSIFHLGGSLDDRSTLYTGPYATAQRVNLFLHLIINIVASGVLASSNFFMQVLVAPSRRDIDAAHATGRWLEIGVQSLRNVLAGAVPKWKAALWLLLALSSVPLHLLANGCVVQAKASTDILALMAAEGFVQRPAEVPLTVPGIMSGLGVDPRHTSATLGDITTTMAEPGRWERLELDACLRRYDTPGQALRSYRHLVMVIGYKNGSAAEDGWTRAAVRKDAVEEEDRAANNAVNYLWWASSMRRTDSTVHTTTADTFSGIPRSYKSPVRQLDLETGVMTLDPERFREPYQEMQMQYCLSERFDAPSQLEIENTLLLVVCTMVVLKCVLCIFVWLVQVRSRYEPLLTPGDAIESFITNPDPTTVGMCALSRDDPMLKATFPNGTIYTPVAQPRQWLKRTRRAAAAVPQAIWVLSYALGGTSLAVGVAMLAIALKEGSLTSSRFGHDSANGYVETPGLIEASLLEQTLVANTPQLILSICYMAYNGLLTRMAAEFEWASFSVGYRPLRVTDKKGEQASTWRLQLPYHWSVPLLVVSIILHWLYSNAIYTSIYIAYHWQWPYGTQEATGLQFSAISVLISFVASLAISVVPLVVAYIKLPGNMVVCGGNSAVISAACHLRLAQPTADQSKTLLPHDEKNNGEVQTRLIGGEPDRLVAAARSRIKWGEVRIRAMDGSEWIVLGPQGTRHLAFGTEDQGIYEASDGQWYTGDVGTN